jgi:hypothetical protein
MFSLNRLLVIQIFSLRLLLMIDNKMDVVVTPECCVAGESKDEKQRDDTELHATRHESCGEEWHPCSGDVAGHHAINAVLHHAQSQEREYHLTCKKKKKASQNKS